MALMRSVVSCPRNGRVGETTFKIYHMMLRNATNYGPNKKYQCERVKNIEPHTPGHKLEETILCFWFSRMCAGAVLCNVCYVRVCLRHRVLLAADGYGLLWLARGARICMWTTRYILGTYLPICPTPTPVSTKLFGWDTKTFKRSIASLYLCGWLRFGGSVARTYSVCSGCGTSSCQKGSV